VIIVFVLSLLVLLGFAALAIDVGYLFSVHGDLQRSADAGALAGAYVFHDGHWPDPVQGKAITRATDFATRDPVGAAPLPAGAVTVTFPAINRIQVDVQDTVNLFFAGVIGSPTVTLTASATAEAVRVGQNVECLKPLAVPLPYVDRNNNDRRDNSNETVSYDCGPGTLCQGTRLLDPRHLRIVDDSSINASEVRQNSGRLFALDMCGSGGVGSFTYQNWIQSRCTETCSGGNPFVADIGSRIRLRNNQSSSPTRAGLQSLINGDNNGATFDTDLPDYPELPTSNDYNEDNWINSPRVVRVILYDPSVVAGPSQTDTRIPVWGFAGFWINRVYQRQTGTSGSPPIPTFSWFVDGYLIPNSAVEKPIPFNPPPPPSIEPSLKTTRLIQ
jgi:hypothetical protein